MNNATIAGHLGADPEVRFTASGQKVTTLRVAARARRSGKEETTIWWKVTIWGEQFDKMITYFKKGSPIIVFGELNKPEIFTNREGQPQVSMSMTAVSLQFSPFGRPDSGHGSQNDKDDDSKEMAYAGGGSGGQKEFGQGKEEEREDEIPF